MNKSNYIDQIGRLKEQFGERAYGDERTNAIWEWAKHAHEKLFALTVTEAIANCAQIPLKGKLMEIYTSIRMKFPELKFSIPCVYCGSYGMVCDNQPLPTAYRCRCENGKRLAQSIPFWKGDLVKMFPSEEEIAVIEARRVERLIQNTMNKKMEKVEGTEL